MGEGLGRVCKGKLVKDPPKREKRNAPKLNPTTPKKGRQKGAKRHQKYECSAHEGPFWWEKRKKRRETLSTKRKEDFVCQTEGQLPRGGGTNVADWWNLGRGEDP